MVSYYTCGETTGEKVNFQKEITGMLHGFGDNPNPNAATVVLVESIVLQQLRAMVQEALNISEQRGSKLITNQDIIFLMRKNKIKLRRLKEYQKKLELTSKVADTPGVITGLGALKDEKDINKKKRTHIDIIHELDEADEVGQIKIDAIEYLRKVRAYKISEALPFDKYSAYHKARCSSFRSNVSTWSKNYAKLEWWINPNKELKITQCALEVLCFLAYETVAEIVDAVFLIRQDTHKKKGDPFSKFDGGYFCNPMSVANAVYIQSGYEGVPAITVPEVREVIRRYFSPNGGMNGLFSRNLGNDIPNKYLAI